MRLPVLAGLMLVFILPFMAPHAAQASSNCRNWPAWNSFRDRFIGEGGRVIDPSTSNSETTSEGQAYALFFALIAEDRPAFERILKWTQDNLAEGDLTARLPAWQWGKHQDGTWRVIDDNSATDADLWLAYTLGEAGRLWDEKKYSALSELLSSRILREETDDLPGLGRTLLPGKKGFHPKPDLWRLNPSYVPLQLIRRLSGLHPGSPWQTLVRTSRLLIVRSASRGFAPDWIMYKSDSQFQPDLATKGVGSFNAIRVYLWAGMLSRQDPAHAVLIKTLAPMAIYIANQGIPPQEVDTLTGTPGGTGSAGFSAAMLPFLDASKQPAALRQQRLRVDALTPFERSDNYYDQALTLFGLGWMEKRYRFAVDGRVIPDWNCEEQKQP
jgi:endoglucanase